MEENIDLLTKMSVVIVGVGANTFYTKAFNINLIFRHEEELCFSQCWVPKVSFKQFLCVKLYHLHGSTSAAVNYYTLRATPKIEFKCSFFYVFI